MVVSQNNKAGISIFVRFCAVLGFFFLNTVCYGQSKHFDLTWTKSPYGFSQNSIVEILAFDSKNTDFSEDQGLYFVDQWRIDGAIVSGSVKIENAVFETVTPSELEGVAYKGYSDVIEYEVKSSTARDLRYAVLKIRPFIKNGAVLKKLRSFDVVYSIGREDNVERFGAKNAMLTSNSVLATGDWFRFEVDKTGVFRVSASFLADLGMDVANLNPNTIKIYGNGGQMLPLLNSENSTFDLRENAIKVLDGGDGVFSGDDFILFYGEGGDKYDIQNDTHINLYDDRSYYYITSGGSSGKRINDLTEPTGLVNATFSTFQDNQFYEVDAHSLAKSGRQWMGDKFDINPSKSYSFEFPDIVSSQKLNVTVKVGATGSSGASMAIDSNLGSIESAIALPVTNYPNLAFTESYTQQFDPVGTSFVVTLDYNNNGNPTNVGYLDYIKVSATRTLTNIEKQLPFSNNQAPLLSGVGAYQLTNAENVAEVWDVTDPANVQTKLNSGGQAQFTVKTILGSDKNFVAVVPSDYYLPKNTLDSRVPNQDLKGAIFLNDQGVFEDVDYLILTTAPLLSQAERLANFHRTTNNLSVKVVNVNAIYTEFNTGKKDIVAIRNFVRYVYENASTPQNRLKYVCLIGDASFDYKNILGNSESNVMPVFETLESAKMSRSFASDDFFVMMDPTEGGMGEANPEGGFYDVGKLDIAVGRILTDNNANFAAPIIDKIIDYQSRTSFGAWRNNYLYVSDDVDEYWEKLIQQDLDELADRVDVLVPSSNIHKIHTDAYVQVSNASGERYPTAYNRILSLIESGVMVVNYFGHGSEEVLATERIFNEASVRSLENISKYPLVITLTCEFTKFDNPFLETVGEKLFWKAKAGASSMITTTRQVTIGTGIGINRELANFLFPVNEVYPTISEALMFTKNIFNNNNGRVIFALGDPAMKLSIPERAIVLTKINDQPIASSANDFEALDKVKLSGQVNKSGALDTTYNGLLSVVVYDKEKQSRTLANDDTTESPLGAGDIVYLDFKELGSVIFKGKASVKNGLFDVEFIVPRDILIPVGNGKISLYSENNNLDEDQTGSDVSVMIGGVNANAVTDTKGPEIRLFMNEESFISGGITNSEPILLANFSDESGINTSSGIGHDMLAILDGDEANPLVLNDFYESNLDDFTSGKLNYKLRSLAPGLHTLSVKVWDVYNNSSVKEIQFLVVAETEFEIANVLNYPNPFISHTAFWFTHSGALQDVLNVQVQVFTVSGKLIWTGNEQGLSGKRTYREDVSWDGRDDFGDRVGKGVYVYKISVKSTLTNKTVNKIEKLVLL